MRLLDDYKDGIQSMRERAVIDEENDDLWLDTMQQRAESLITKARAEQ